LRSSRRWRSPRRRVVPTTSSRRTAGSASRFLSRSQRAAWACPYIPIDHPSKIAAIVITQTQKIESSAKVQPTDAQARQIVGHLIEFLNREIRAG
jgi:acyl-CoA hydrolase